MGIYTIDPSWRSRVIGNRQIQEQSKPPKSVPQKAKKWQFHFVFPTLQTGTHWFSLFYICSIFHNIIAYCGGVVIFNALGFDSSRNLLITQVIKMLQTQNRPFLQL